MSRHEFGNGSFSFTLVPFCVWLNNEKLNQEFYLKIMSQLWKLRKKLLLMYPEYANADWNNCQLTQENYF